MLYVDCISIKPGEKLKKKKVSRKRLSQDLAFQKMLWWPHSCLTHLSVLTNHRLEEWIPWCPWVCLECWLLHCLPGGLKPTASLPGHQLPSSGKWEWEPLPGGLGWEEEALISGTTCKEESTMCLTTKINTQSSMRKQMWTRHLGQRYVSTHLSSARCSAMT